MGCSQAGPSFQEIMPELHGSIDPQIFLGNRTGEISRQSDPTRINTHRLNNEKAIHLCQMSLQKYKNALPGERKEMMSEIKWLCSCLEDHPLAIQQAIAYLNGQIGAVSIADFIEKYENNVNEFQGRRRQVGGEYSHIVATVFHLSMNIIGKTDCALEMLYILSFCAAGGTLIEYFEFLYGKTVATKAVSALVKFNLASLRLRVKVRRRQQERDTTLHQLARECEALKDDDDKDSKSCIAVNPIVQKVVRELVLKNLELIEVVFQAAFIAETGENFHIMETLMENNQQVDDFGCDLYFIFLHHWQLVHTNQVAAAAVMMTVFCRLDKVFPWEGIFGRKQWMAARSVLEQTCFRSLCLNKEEYIYLFSPDVRDLIRKLTEQDKDWCLILLSSISKALEVFENATSRTELRLSNSKIAHYIRTFQKVRRRIR